MSFDKSPHKRSRHSCHQPTDLTSPMDIDQTAPLSPPFSPAFSSEGSLAATTPGFTPVERTRGWMIIAGGSNDYGRSVSMTSPMGLISPLDPDLDTGSISSSPLLADNAQAHALPNLPLLRTSFPPDYVWGRDPYQDTALTMEDDEDALRTPPTTPPNIFGLPDRSGEYSNNTTRVPFSAAYSPFSVPERSRPFLTSQADPQSPTRPSNETQSPDSINYQPLQPQLHPSPKNSKRSSKFATKLTQMALSLAPLVQLTTGVVHPSFPRTLLCFWLLTDSELESMAAFYHQRTPGPWTARYPCPIAERWRSDASLEEKRRRMGRFIGLRGCESPTLPTATLASRSTDAGQMDWDRFLKSEEQLEEEARRTRERQEEEEVWRRKLHWY